MTKNNLLVGGVLTLICLAFLVTGYNLKQASPAPIPAVTLQATPAPAPVPQPEVKVVPSPAPVALPQAPAYVAPVATPITVDQAPSHVGQKVSLTFTVASSHRGAKVIHLNSLTDYQAPGNVSIAVDISKVPALARVDVTTLVGRKVKVEGTLKIYHGGLSIYVASPQALSL